MDRPTSADVRAWVPPAFDWVAMAGYAPAPAAGDPDPLDVRVKWAWAEEQEMTGRDFSQIEVDSNDEALVQKLTALWVMYGAMGGGPAALRVMAQPWLRSFTAGSYSETRFSPSELDVTLRGATPDVIARLHPVAEIGRLLWLLATPTKQADWTSVLLNREAPIGGIVEENWGGTPLVYGYPPDGFVNDLGAPYDGPWGLP